jgi:hypothetical protein
MNPLARSLAGDREGQVATVARKLERDYRRLLDEGDGHRERRAESA